MRFQCLCVGVASGLVGCHLGAEAGQLGIYKLQAANVRTGCVWKGVNVITLTVEMKCGHGAEWSGWIGVRGLIVKSHETPTRLAPGQSGESVRQKY